jgi:hypothetical protein
MRLSVVFGINIIGLLHELNKLAFVTVVGYDVPVFEQQVLQTQSNQKSDHTQHNVAISHVSSK